MAKGAIDINILAKMSDSSSIPKFLQVLGTDLSVKFSQWFDSDKFHLEYDEGIYVVQLSLSSGEQMEQVVPVKANETTPVQFDLTMVSPRESQEWAYFTKSHSQSPEKKRKRISGNMDPWDDTSSSSKAHVMHVQAIQWDFLNGQWESKALSMLQDHTIDPWGETFELFVTEGMHVLQFTGKDMQPLCVCVPPHNDHIKCLVKLADGPASVVHPLDVALATSNKHAQALLSMVMQGDTGRGKTLFDEKKAEELFFEKMVDPVGAVVGGYYLLMTGALERMHNWADNLANRFPWLPDGSIIHAWQLIKEDRESKKDISIIQQRLLEAAHRGIPIYTEGLRLLYEGLKLLAYNYSRIDPVIEEALAKVKQYVAYADMSQENTTFTGVSPGSPGLLTKELAVVHS
jgi:hypothetical protein